MVDMDLHISSHLNEELDWAADKWVQVINTIHCNNVSLHYKIMIMQSIIFAVPDF